MKLNTIQDQNHVTVAVSGTIDTETSVDFRDALLALDFSDLDLTLDFQNTDYITSAGLRVLLIVRKKLPKEKLHILHVNETIAEIFEMTGFSSLLNYSAQTAEIPDVHMSFKALLKQKPADAAAFVWLDRTYTWGDVDRVSQIIAADLAAMGVKKGSHVGI